MATEVIVYQVRAVDPHGNTRIVHAYATEDEAKQAITMMRGRTNTRYVYVPVPNQPDQYWGINLPDKK